MPALASHSGGGPSCSEKEESGREAMLVIGQGLFGGVVKIMLFPGGERLLTIKMASSVP